ncbi:MAG: IPExxxVDY family protein [Bacteroidota bacterium]
MAKVIKHKLSFDDEADFELIGICTHHTDFRLAFGINEQMAIALEKKDDFAFIPKGKKEEILFSRYDYTHPEDQYQFILIKNKADGKFLITEKPMIDYFLFIYENHLFELSELVDSLRKITVVLAAYSFDPNELDSTQHINLI